MPKKTVELIKQSGNDYLIAVKGNQKKLLLSVQAQTLGPDPIDTFHCQEINRGRIENRFVALYDQPVDLPRGWESVQRVIMINRYGQRPDTGPYDEKHYYILSKPINDAELVAAGVRFHWHIENRLHYVKDVRFGEDKNGIRQGSPAAVLSLFQDMTINIYRCLGYNSIKYGIIQFANKVKELKRILSAKHISDL